MKLKSKVISFSEIVYNIKKLEYKTNYNKTQFACEAFRDMVHS
jgi:hypothetical protein